MSRLLNILFLLVLGFCSKMLVGQSTTFTGEPGQWVGPANWSNGVPSSTKNAIINGRCRTAAGGGSCLNLDVLAGKRIRLSGENTITVNGILNVAITAIVEFDGGGLQLLDNIELDGTTKIEIDGGLLFSSGFDIGQ